jgi:hypothetical protein
LTIFNRGNRLKRKEDQQFAEKLNFLRLIKNGQMQGARSSESGVATKKERLLATPARW